jgi:O-acetyl-ADP-ribose deacetylase (regulator of RNase III)
MIVAGHAMPSINPPALDAYRSLVALDEPFVPPAAEPERDAGLLGVALDHLEHEGLGRMLREGLGSAVNGMDARRLLRALLTVRAPGPLPGAVHDAIDGILQLDRLARPAVDARGLPRFALAGTPGPPPFALWQGDITTIAADAIVNAANSQMLGCFQPFHGCIDNAIHWAAGPRLREDCDRIMRAQGGPEPTGHAKATRAYNLPSRFVLHTVGPIVRGSLTPRHEVELAQSYRSCLDVARQIGGVRSVVFCGISTGVFGFPRDAAAQIALRTTRAWMREHADAIDVVVFNVFGDQDKAAYVRAIEQGRP